MYHPFRYTLLSVSLNLLFSHCLVFFKIYKKKKKKKKKKEEEIKVTTNKGINKKINKKLNKKAKGQVSLTL